MNNCNFMKENGMRPSHPGAILTGMIEGLREESGKDYSISEIAAGLGISSETLSSILAKSRPSMRKWL